jgi:hypothetical protein
MVVPTCFGITLPSTGRVPSAFWEMLNWGAVDRILWMGVFTHHVTRQTEWIIGVFVGFSRIFLLGILISKGLTARRVYKSFGVKGLMSCVWLTLLLLYYYWIKHNGVDYIKLPLKLKIIHNKRRQITRILDILTRCRVTFGNVMEQKGACWTYKAANEIQYSVSKLLSWLADSDVKLSSHPSARFSYSAFVQRR